MDRNYKQLSNDVIIYGEKQYFSRVYSADGLDRKLYEDEVTYGTIIRDIEISLMKDSHYTDAILITFCKEEDEGMSYIDVIISDFLGTFISDWY